MNQVYEGKVIYEFTSTQSRLNVWGIEMLDRHLDDEIRSANRIFRTFENSLKCLICPFLPKEKFLIVWKSSKMSYLNFSILVLAVGTNFFPIKIDLSGNTVWPSFKSLPNWTIFGIFNEFLTTQNVNIARFACNAEWDFFCDFQTLCKYCKKDEIRLS